MIVPGSTVSEDPKGIVTLLTMYGLFSFVQISSPEIVPEAEVCAEAERGIKRIDTHRTVTVLKFKGKETGVSTAEVSPDGKVLKIETDYVSSNPIGKEIQYWDRQ